MLILLDIGNTAVSYGVKSGKNDISFGSCHFNNIPILFKKLLKNGVNNNIDVVLSSVVPINTSIIKKLLHPREPLGFNPRGSRGLWVAGENLPVPIPHRYKKGKPGIDRLVNAYGALKKYSPPFLIIDYGTAITFDYISKSGVFEGGLIIPGPEISLQALIERAALLPKKMRLPSKTKGFLGRQTFDAMNSGVLEGCGAMTDELVARFKKRYGRNLCVIATGGFAKTVKKFSSSLKIVDPHHTLKSLLRVYLDFMRLSSP